MSEILPLNDRNQRGRIIGWRAGRAAVALTIVALLVLIAAGWMVRHFLFPASREEDDARRHWRRAQELIAAREFFQATDELTQCLEAWPYNAEANFLMARTWRRAGHFTTWRIYLQRAETLRWPKKQLDLERQLRRAQIGDVWDVEESLIELLNKPPPEETIILEALVAGFMAADRLIDVIALTTTWIDRYPEDWLPHILRGNAELRLYGKSSEAAKDFQRVLELKPHDPDAHLALAQVLANQGDYNEAIPHFELCLSSEALDATEVLFGLATCQFSLGSTDQARAALEQLFAKNKDHGGGCFLQAKVELADGREEEALKWLEKADKLSPDETDVTNALLQICRRLSRKEDLERYQRRLDDIRLRNDKMDRLLTLLKSYPEDPQLRYEVGKICLDRDRAKEANHWFQAILYKDPNHLPTLTTLADYYAKKGNTRTAAYYRRKADKARGSTPVQPPEHVQN
jgi:tetratricopeptide (TPR) repeat protein